jgi:heme O synthase-like polyprenyltransferase
MAIAPNDSLITALSTPGRRDYLELTKPKVSLLIVLTAIVGMVLASPGMVPLPALVFGTPGIAMASGSAALRGVRSTRRWLSLPGLGSYRGARPDLPIRSFRFSITYLMALFGAFIADHYCRLLV